MAASGYRQWVPLLPKSEKTQSKEEQAKKLTAAAALLILILASVATRLRVLLLVSR
jgi:hypothetical protein